MNEETHLIVDHRIQIPLTEIEFTYARSGGPGGQNVNKVNTKAVMRWPILASVALPEDVKQRFMAAFATSVTTAGDMMLTGQRFRSAGRNMEDCLDKLRTMLASVAKPPKVRRPTRPTLGSKIRRRESKSHRSQTKTRRRDPGADE